jgi:hypothetical protein
MFSRENIGDTRVAFAGGDFLPLIGNLRKVLANYANLCYTVVSS